MAFFKKKPSVVWRNKQGEAECPGDLCPQECDERCPIWVNSIALQMLQMGRYDQAIELYQKSLAIDPNIPETYNNMAMAYGMSNNHREAYNSFKKAVELKPGYVKALRGLIVAEKNLGLFVDALTHCDEFNKLPGNDADELRRDVIAARDGVRSDVPKAIEQTELLLKLLEKGREAGFIQSEGLTHIPEVMIQSKPVCEKIMRDLLPHYMNDMVSGASIMLAWSAYAGMGAVYHWHVDWATLQKNGIFETLSGARGLEEMDEYVMDSIGLKFGTPEEKEVTEFLRTLSYDCIAFSVAPAGKNLMDALHKACSAMYNFGMVFEMNRLGMK